MILFGPHDVLGGWLCEKIGYVPTVHFRCIGNVNEKGEIKGVVGFDGWNGASCQIHVAGEGNWVNRELIRCVFDYAFNTAEMKVLIGAVPSGNERAIHFDKRMGFKEVARIKDAHPDGELIILSMRRDECRFLEKKEDGKQSYSSAA